MGVAPEVQAHRYLEKTGGNVREALTNLMYEVHASAESAHDAACIAEYIFKITLKETLETASFL